MKYKFIINQRLPILNDYINKCKHNRHIAANFKAQIDRNICWEIRAQLGNIKITKPVVLHITWIEQNKRRDVDNVYSAIKYIQDALVKMQVLENDGVKNVIDVKNKILYEKESKVIVEIEEIDD